jgi:hypothetical protein
MKKGKVKSKELFRFVKKVCNSTLNMDLYGSNTSDFKKRMNSKDQALMKISIIL